jgi:hypothetical protein
MGSIALLLVVIITVIAVAACVFLPGQNIVPSLTSQQKDMARQVLINDKFINNLSDVGEPESFGKGHELFDTNRTLALVPVMQNGQNVSTVFLVDLDRNTTIGQFVFTYENITLDHVKALINITVDAPIVKDTFWDKDLMFIKVDFSGFMDTAPGYDNWSGRFITADISMDDPFHKYNYFHKIKIIEDDTALRVLDVSDWFFGDHYTYSPEYVIIPPGQEKQIDIIGWDWFRNISRYVFWTSVTLEPQDAKVYPIIFEGSYNKLKNNISANALEYKDSITGDIKHYDGSQLVGSGWSANISFDQYGPLHLILKNAETKRDIQAWVNRVPDREMINILENRSRNVSVNNSSK